MEHRKNLTNFIEKQFFSPSHFYYKNVSCETPFFSHFFKYRKSLFFVFIFSSTNKLLWQKSQTPIFALLKTTLPTAFCTPTFSITFFEKRAISSPKKCIQNKRAELPFAIRLLPDDHPNWLTNKKYAVVSDVRIII